MALRGPFWRSEGQLGWSLGWSPEQLYRKNKKHTNFYYGPRPQKTPKKIWDQFDQIWTFKNGHFKTQICIYVIFSKLFDFNVL